MCVLKGFKFKISLLRVIIGSCYVRVLCTTNFLDIDRVKIFSNLLEDDNVYFIGWSTGQI